MRGKRLLLLAKMGGSPWQQFAIKNKILLLALTALAVLSFGVMLVANYFQVELIGAVAGIKGLSLFFASLVACFLTLIFSLLGGATTIYRGREMALLMSLPIAPVELYTSRLLRHYLVNIPLYLLLYLPGLGVYYFLNSFSLASLFILLMGSFPVLILSATLSQVLYLAISSKRRTRRKEFLATFLLVGALLVSQGFANRFFTSGLDKSSLGTLALSYQTILPVAFKWLFPFNWVRKVASEGSFVAFVSLTALFCLVVVIAFGIGFKTFIKTATKALEGESGGSRGRKRKTSRVSLLKKELAVINSASAFMIELYLEAFIPLVLILVWLITGVLKELSVLVEILSQTVYLPLIVSGVLLLMGNLNLMSSTSISREGRQFVLMRTLPIAVEEHLRAKVTLHMIFFFLPHCLYLTGALLWLKVSPIHLIWMLPLAFALIATTSFIGLAIDYRRPRLEWQNPQQAVKQNLNGLIGMAFSLVALLVCTAVVVLFSLLIGAKIMALGFIAVAVALAELLISYKVAYKGALVCYGGKGIRTPDLLIANQSL